MERLVVAWPLPVRSETLAIPVFVASRKNVFQLFSEEDPKDEVVSFPRSPNDIIILTQYWEKKRLPRFRTSKINCASLGGHSCTHHFGKEGGGSRLTKMMRFQSSISLLLPSACWLGDFDFLIVPPGLRKNDT